MVCWVHGANSSGQVFNYIIDRMPEHEHVRFEYKVTTPLRENLERLEAFVALHGCEIVVGHSMGGVMAALLMARGKIKKGVAISSPLAGMLIGNFVPFIQVLIDLRITNPLYGELRRHRFDDRFLSIVATGFEPGYNDGVVPCASQRALCGGKKLEFVTNHYEVMLNKEVATAISGHVFSNE